MEYPFIKISGYNHYCNKEGVRQPGCIPYDTDLYTELYRIKNGYYQSVIDTLRQIEDKAERMDFKTRYLPSLTISVVCKEWRQTSNIISHTGLLNIDIDPAGNNINDWGLLRDTIFYKSPHVVAAFISASGQGMAFIVKIDERDHLDVFNSIQMELKDTLGISIDKVTKDKVRLRFVSYDPDCRIRDDFNNIKCLVPSVPYMLEKKRKLDEYIHSIPTGGADSVHNFKRAVAHAEQNHSFVDGAKHRFLISLGCYCNKSGMSESYCKKMVVTEFLHLTTLPPEKLLIPITNAYSTYKRQHNTEPIKKTGIPFRHLRWLLGFFDKNTLKERIPLYGRQIIGTSPDRIGVSSPLLVFCMSIVSPQYSWTCLDTYKQFLDNDQCKRILAQLKK